MGIFSPVWLLALQCLAPSAWAAAVPISTSTASLPRTANVIYQFPVGRVLEKSYARSNGQLLISFTSSPDIYQIDPTHTQSGTKLFTFTGYQSTQGIAEISKDVFVITLGNYTGPPVLSGQVGSYSVWKLDLTGSTPQASKIVDVPQANNLDAIIATYPGNGLFIATDTTLGLLYRIDVNRKTATQVLTDPLFARNDSTAGLGSIGVDGIGFRGTDLYFTNFDRGYFGKVPFNVLTATPTGKASLVYQEPGQILNGFALDLLGNFFITRLYQGVILLRNTVATFVATLPGTNTVLFARNGIVPNFNTLYATYFNQTDGSSGIAKIDVTGLS